MKEVNKLLRKLLTLASISAAVAAYAGTAQAANPTTNTPPVSPAPLAPLGFSDDRMTVPLGFSDGRMTAPTASPTAARKRPPLRSQATAHRGRPLRFPEISRPWTRLPEGAALGLRGRPQNPRSARWRSLADPPAGTRFPAGQVVVTVAAVATSVASHRTTGVRRHASDATRRGRWTT
jgi:hypothetical protein